jgi:hypothetical protein
MSEKNGDKSRFGRERQKKMLRRLRSRELRKTIEAKSAEPEAANPAEVETPKQPAG